MSYKGGFTLLELLIAAAIIGVLSLFAMQSFRTAGSDARWQEAKIRAQVVASAVKRYYIEYPNAAPLRGLTVELFNEKGACNPSEAKVQNLVNCGFLEANRQFASEFGGVASNFTMTIKRSGGVNVVCVEAREEAKGRVAKGKYCTDGEMRTE